MLCNKNSGGPYPLGLAQGSCSKIPCLDKAGLTTSRYFAFRVSMGSYSHLHS